MSETPEDLQVLTLKSICKFVSDSVHLQDVSRVLKILEVQLPQTLANTLTSSLLIELGPAFNKHEVVGEILSACIHSDTTELDMLHLRHYSTAYLLAVARALQGLSRLKRLRVLYGLIERHDDNEIPSLSIALRSMSQLVSLTVFEECSDDVLAAAAESCPNLAFLQVKNSHAVTDASVGAILQMHHLTTLELFDTNIGDAGLEQLLMEFSVRVPQMLRFGCNYLKEKHVRLLASCYGITDLHLQTMMCDLLSLKALPFLQKLKIKFCNYNLVVGLLRECGDRLRHLSLWSVYGVEVDLLGISCPNLETLDLIACKYRGPPVTRYEDLSPTSVPFQNLQCLIATVYDTEHVAYILSCSINVHKVHLIGMGSWMNDTFMNTVLARNPMAKLEEFFIYRGRCSLAIARKLLARCPKLTVLRSCALRKGKTERDHSLDEFCEEMHKVFPNLNMNFMSNYSAVPPGFYDTW